MFLEREMYLDTEKDFEEMKNFLHSLNLKIPQDLDYTIGIYEGNNLIGTGSLGGNIIKGIGISPKFQGQGISAIIVTNLLKKAIELGIDNIFVYTKPSSEPMFLNLGFKEIAKASPYAVLLEWGNGLESYISKLKEASNDKALNASCIIINGNPFTLGHRYLIEKALVQSKFLYILVVEEDKSLFPFKVRFKLIEEGLKDIKNIKVIAGGDYIISAATFPSYFTKDVDLSIAQASLDLDLFSNHIAPALKISKRFVGEEPICPVTSVYNRAMKEILPKRGIEVIEIPRLEIGGSYVSASRVREALKTGDIESIKNIVPISTYDYLKSPKGEEIIKKIKAQKR